MAFTPIRIAQPPRQRNPGIPGILGEAAGFIAGVGELRERKRQQLFQNVLKIATLDPQRAQDVLRREFPEFGDVEIRATKNPRSSEIFSVVRAQAGKGGPVIYASVDRQGNWTPIVNDAGEKLFAVAAPKPGELPSVEDAREVEGKLDVGESVRVETKVGTIKFTGPEAIEEPDFPTPGETASIRRQAITNDPKTSIQNLEIAIGGLQARTKLIPPELMDDLRRVIILDGKSSTESFGRASERIIPLNEYNRTVREIAKKEAAAQKAPRGAKKATQAPQVQKETITQEEATRLLADGFTQDQIDNDFTIR